MSPRAALLLAAPGTLLLLLLMIGPALAVLPVALTDWEFGRPDFEFVGLANFRELAGDLRFTAAFWNTLAYLFVVTPATVTLGLLLAVEIDQAGRLKALYRAAHFLPVVATMAAMAIAWEAVLHPTFGLLNTVLVGLGASPRNWLMDERLVLPTLMAIGVWQNLGFAVVMFLAGLKTVPRELYEAAQIDGAVRPLDRMRTVTLPLLGAVTLFVAVITAKRALAVFDTVAVLTRGGPGEASEVILHLLYVESFERLRAGYGAAITVVYLLMLMAVTAAQRTLDKRVHYR